MPCGRWVRGSAHLEQRSPREHRRRTRDNQRSTPQVPSPACGGGLGWGRVTLTHMDGRVRNCLRWRLDRDDSAPLPDPPPQAGEGTEALPSFAGGGRELKPYLL